MPRGAIYVGRPSKFGNPFTVKDAMDNGFAENVEDARSLCVEAFENWSKGGNDWWMGPECERRREALKVGLAELRGKDLACWCAMDVPCHADILLRLANG